MRSNGLSTELPKTQRVSRDSVAADHSDTNERPVALQPVPSDEDRLPVAEENRLANLSLADVSGWVGSENSAETQKAAFQKRLRHGKGVPVERQTA